MALGGIKATPICALWLPLRNCRVNVTPPRFCNSSWLRYESAVSTTAFLIHLFSTWRILLSHRLMLPNYLHFCLVAKVPNEGCLRTLVLWLTFLGFIKNCNLIRAKVPILKFRDQLSGVECDLNVNNVVGIYNTHLLAMYTRVDWRLRPLGIFVKNWAQKMDIHDGSRGRLSTYPLLLMLIQFLQCGCSPPVLPSLQARFPVSLEIRATCKP